MNMREELKAFVDNELPEERRAEILRAIENDPALQAEVIELRQMSRMIHEEAWQPEPRGLEQTLTALTARKKKTPWWTRPQVGWALGAACVIAIAVVLFPNFSQAKMAAKRDMNAASSKVLADRDSASMDKSPVEPEFKQESRSAYGVATNSLPPEPGSPADQALANRSRAKAKGQELDFRAAKSTAEAQDQANVVAPLDENARAPAAFKPESNGVEDFATSPRFQIKQADIAIEVPDVPKAQRDAESIATSVGGRVESSVKNAQEGSLASAELTLRVPVNRFETAVNRARGLGHVLSDAISGADVTGQVVDTEARLKVLRAEEDQYVELLRSTKKVGEVLSVKERLSQVRQEIETLDAGRKLLRNQAAESALNLSLTEKPTTEKPQRDENWLEGIWAKAVSGLGAVGRALGAAAVYIFVYSPIWLPCLLLAWLVAKRRRR